MKLSSPLVFLLAASFGAASLSAPGFAQDCPSGPVFVEIRTSNSDVRASARALIRGDLEIATHFAQEALNSGAASGHKAAAQVNLCAAYGRAGERRLAAQACEQAVRDHGETWQALTNRGAAAWLMGDLDPARAHFAAAAALAPDEDAVRSNAELARCAG